MKKHLLLTSVAAIGLAAAPGPAQAADIPAPVMPVYTPVVVAPAAGPVRVIRIDTTLSRTTGGLDLETNAGVDVRTAAGWGFQLVVNNTIDLDGAPLDGYGGLLGRVYRAVGDATVGVFASTNATYTLGVGVTGEGFAVGIDLDYKTDTVDLFYILGVNFDGGFDGIQSILGASIERGNFHIDILSIGGGPPLTGVGAASLGYAIGPITPYVSAAAGVVPGPGFVGAVGAGVDFEHEIGDRLTLTANAGLNYLMSGMGNALSWTANAGFEYALGGRDGPLTLHGNVGTSSNSGLALQWELGIGLKLGEGRMTGFGRLLFDGLPGNLAL